MYLTEPVYLYWIHLMTEQDINIHGYVGITKFPERRFKEHQTRTKNPSNVTKNILENNGDVLYEILYCGDFSSCLKLEREFRPTTRIGWNVAKGGVATKNEALTGITKSVPVWNRGIAPSDEQIRKYKETWKNKMGNGYVSPNKGKTGRPSPKKGKPGKSHPNTRVATSGLWQIYNTETNETDIILGLRCWAKSMGFNDNTVSTYSRTTGKYKNFIFTKIAK